MALTTSYAVYATSPNYSAVSVGFKYGIVSGTTVRIYMGLYVSSSYSGGYGSDYCTAKINGSTRRGDGSYSGGSYRVYGVGWTDIATYDYSVTSGGSGGNNAVSLSWSIWSYHFQATPSGTVTIPAGIISPSYYCTACGAPTACTVSPTLQSPNAAVTVSWSGATVGTNNSITGYDIVFGGSTKSVSSTASSGSVSFSNLGLTRASTQQAKVRTKGSAGSNYYSGYKTSTNSVLINSLPSVPTISGSDKTISSEAEAPTFTITKGSDVNSSQTVTLYYNTTNSTSGATTTTGTATVTIDPTQGATKTIYAWSYDGLEFSDPVSRSVTRKTATTLSSLKIFERSSDMVQIEDSDIGIPLKLFKILSLTASQTFSKIRVYYRQATDTDSLSSATWTLIKDGYELGEDIDTVNLDLQSGYVFQFGVSLYETSTSSWSSTINLNKTYRAKSFAKPTIGTDSILTPENHQISLIIPTLTNGNVLIKKCYIDICNSDSALMMRYEINRQKAGSYLKDITFTPFKGQTLQLRGTIEDYYGNFYSGDSITVTISNN